MTYLQQFIKIILSNELVKIPYMLVLIILRHQI